MINAGEAVAKEILFNHYYEMEKPGDDSNPIILKIIQWALPYIQDDADAAWCAIYMSYMFHVCGYDHLFPKTMLARDPHNKEYGKEVSVEEAQLGDIVVYWRISPDSWKGHVGIVIRVTDDVIYTLGGNQDNKINITPYKRSTVLSIRRLEI